MATEKLALHVPSLEELCTVLQNGLQESFASVQVSVVECPDLTQHPFSFPVQGICGHPRITDVGGVPYLIPLAQIDKLIPLIWTENKDRCTVNSSYYSTVNMKDQTCVLGKYSDKFSDCDIALLGNLYACQGNPGKVVQIMATKRTGEYSLVTAMRKTLEKQYEKPVAMGGTFIIQKGKAKIHIMPPEFSVCPLNTDDDVNNWLKYFEVSAPLICQSVLVSKDPGLDLRVEHTHCFSHHGEGGHYYIDTTPESVEYLGYFLPAEFLYRIDRPKETHQIGRE
ncbi:ester hydrolase C11orf54 homolog isoform X2 [Erpetoichthys calabaricus]|uniref:ester hydrolase C11orf54 homolog isoform X2 n=1 Tax=Erpetoichthys calabaricus TaxID=27687 RepID=UPI0022346CA2|nr:ester hydrolase C11orf54 homolog isoform X2 [Erpetoichthys calabaricus]